MWSLVFLAKGVAIGLNGIRKVQLGSRVRHDGVVWFVSNWAGGPRMNLSGPSYKESVPDEEITPIHSLREFAHRFRFMMNWYLTNWHAIDVQNRLDR